MTEKLEDLENYLRIVFDHADAKGRVYTKAEKWAIIAMLRTELSKMTPTNFSYLRNDDEAVMVINLNPEYCWCELLWTVLRLFANSDYAVTRVEFVNEDKSLFKEPRVLYPPRPQASS